MKEDYDGAEPAASSYALSNLLRLAALAAPDEAQVDQPAHILFTLHTSLPSASVLLSCALTLMRLKSMQSSRSARQELLISEFSTM